MECSYARTFPKIVADTLDGYNVTTNQPDTVIHSSFRKLRNGHGDGSSAKNGDGHVIGLSRFAFDVFYSTFWAFFQAGLHYVTSVWFSKSVLSLDLVPRGDEAVLSCQNFVPLSHQMK